MSLTGIAAAGHSFPTPHSGLRIGREGLRRNIGETIKYTDCPAYIGKLAYDDRRGFYVKGSLKGMCRKLVRDGDEIELPVRHTSSKTVMRKYQVQYGEMDNINEGLWGLRAG